MTRAGRERRQRQAGQGVNSPMYWAYFKNWQRSPGRRGRRSRLVGVVEMRSSAPHVIHSLGLAERSLEEFLAALTTFSIELVVDVRRFPTSRRHPHLEGHRLHATLETHGVSYRFLGRHLGGNVPRRVPPEQSANRGWDTEAMRRYADAMEYSAFSQGLDELQRLAQSRITVFVCGVRDPERSHRQILADALTVRGWQVRHILGPQSPAREHRLTPFARVESGGKLYYPPSEASSRKPGLEP